MKAHRRRIERLEDETITTDKVAPTNLQELYDLEDDPDSDMSRELQAFYDPEKSIHDVK